MSGLLSDGYLSTKTLTGKSDYLYYIYNNGAEFIDITGGWSADNYGLTESFSTTQPTKSINGMLVDAGELTGVSCFAGTQSMVDVSDFSYLKVEIVLTKATSDPDVVFLGIGEVRSPAWAYYDGRVFVSGTIGTTQTLIIDISAINKSDYIYISTYNRNACTVKKVWLE